MCWTHRTRLYATGAALALLLDRLRIQWREQRGTTPGLAQVLSEHLRFNRVGNPEEVQQLLDRYGRLEIEARVQDMLREAGYLPVLPAQGHDLPC
jgi:hypothetical protein